METKKQTPINFLAIELINKSENDYSNAQTQKIITIDLDLFYQLVEKSLIMEKEQIIDAYFSAIKSTGEGWNGEYAQGNSPNIEETFQEEFNKWFEQYG